MLFNRRTRLDDASPMHPDVANMIVGLSADINTCACLVSTTQTAIDAIKTLETTQRHSTRIRQLKLNIYDLSMVAIRVVGDGAEEEIIPPVRDMLNEATAIFSNVCCAARKIVDRGSITALLNYRQDKATIKALRKILIEKTRDFELLELATLAQGDLRQPSICSDNQKQTPERVVMPSARHWLSIGYPRLFRLAKLPYMPDFYLGREEFLQHGLSSVLSSSNSVAISGPGASGKTSLALAIAHHRVCAKYFGERRYFISCESSSSTDHLLQLIARVIEIPHPFGSHNRSSLLRSLLSIHRPTLLIFDHLDHSLIANAEECLLFDELLTQIGTSTSIRLIVTSRAELAHDTIQTTMRLAAPSWEAASSLFLAYHPSAMPGDYKDFVCLATQIDCYPLTVRLLAAHKKASPSASLVDEWSVAQRDVSEEHFDQRDTPSSVMTAVALVLNSAALANRSEALKLLQVMSVFHHGLNGDARRIELMGLKISNVKHNMKTLFNLSLLGKDSWGQLIVPSPVQSCIPSRSLLPAADVLRGSLSGLLAFYFAKDEPVRNCFLPVCFEMTDIASFIGLKLKENPTLALARSTYVFAMLQYHILPSDYPMAALIGALHHVSWTQQLSSCNVQLKALLSAQLRVFGDRLDCKGFTRLVLSVSEIALALSRHIELELGQSSLSLSEDSVVQQTHARDSVRGGTQSDATPNDICSHSASGHDSSVTSISSGHVQIPNERCCELSGGRSTTCRLCPAEINCQMSHHDARPELSSLSYEDLDSAECMEGTSKSVPRLASSLSGLTNTRNTTGDMPQESSHTVDLRQSELELFCTLNVYKNPGVRVRNNSLDIDASFTDELLNELYTTLYMSRERSSCRSPDRRLGNILVRVAHACNRFPSALLISGIRVARRDYCIAGGFADIFEGVLDSRKVALKRFRTFSSQEQESIRKKFCREVVLWRLLDHPHVLSFIGLDEKSFAPRVCMVSPWMEQGNLLEYTLKAQPSISKVNELLFQVADGLQYLHRQEIVHGDLRCANILINDQYQACLADFGLSALLSGGIIQTDTNSLGSARWNAPELYSSNSPLQTKQTDIYAFGCVCLEIHTRKCPFPEMIIEFAVIITLMSGGRPSRPSPSDSPSADMRDALWEMIEQCWEVDPERRPPLSQIKRTLSELGDT